jgi:hypothetical protein
VFHRIFAFIQRHPDPDRLGIDIIDLPKSPKAIRQALETAMGDDPMRRPLLQVTLARISSARPPTSERMHALVRDMREGRFEPLENISIPANACLDEAAFHINCVWTSAKMAAGNDGQLAEAPAALPSVGPR